MAQAQVNFKMDAELKAQAAKIFNDIGMDMTTAFTVFAKQVVRTGGIPFELTTDPFYSKANQRHLAQAIADMDAGRNTVVGGLVGVDD